MLAGLRERAQKLDLRYLGRRRRVASLAQRETHDPVFQAL